MATDRLRPFAVLPLLLALLLALATALRAQIGVDADWAFAPLRLHEPPPTGDPVWDTSPIDRFVRSAQRAAGLPPAPPADRRTLLRRASFALTGLPPTADEVDAFVADPADDDTAFARVVDQFLASPHYGEQQARHWLDLARYSDSNGLDENLAFANAFRYRDWVVRAHNDDLPYDRFVQLQIAGDLLADDPAVGLDGHVATGFLALGPRMLAEQDKEKLVLDTVDEQLDLVGRTVLGLTIGCARCHDHKFDPIRQRDYYALAGIFRSTKTFAELGHVSRWFDHELATTEQIATRQRAEAEAEAAKQALDAAVARAEQQQREQLVGDVCHYLLAAHALTPHSLFVQAEAASDTSLAADDRHWGDADTVVLHTHRGGEQFAAWRLDVATAGRYQLLVRCAAAESRPMRVLVDGHEVVPKVLDATTGGWLPAHQDWLDGGCFDLATGDHELRLVAHGPHVPHLDALLLVPLAVPASEPDRGGEHGGDHGALLPPVLARTVAVLHSRRHDPLLALFTDLAAAEPAAFGERAAAMQGRGGMAALLLGGLPPMSRRELAARVQTLVTTTAAATAAQAAGKDGQKHLAEPSLEAVRTLLFDRGGLLALPAETLRAWLPAATAAQLQDLTTAHAEKVAAVPAKAPTAMCVADGDVVDLPVHLRGSHLTLAPEPTPRGVLSVFASFVPPPSLPAHGSGRVELARWLFAPEQALAARVQANRLWQRAFGQGLSRSPSNFGRRGDRPVLPELLDWLAHDLRAHGWSQKHLWRTILLSRTWRQAASDDPVAHERDPENRRHGRHQRQRLQAEAIRDAMLATAGTLDRSLGGSLLTIGDRDYVTNDQSADAARYDAPRRSLYLPIIRNAMFDLFVAFDYADPSVHLEQRPQTAVATQALWLLNAPFVRQQSRALAMRTLAAAGDDPARVLWLWRQVLQRAPSERERQLAADWLGRGGEPSAAFTDLAHALFAGNEFVYVD